MRLTRSTGSAFVALAFTVTAATGFAANSAASPDHEVTRIRVHFDSVLTGLALRDLGDLTAGQRARRTALVETLRDYRERGVFPHNYDFPGQSVPYFVDRKTGTLCAVAHLMASTGRRDIVDRVATSNNNVWVPQLAGDSAFTGWLAENGITLDEAAFIQVPYAVDGATPILVSNGPNPALIMGLMAGTSLTMGTAVVTSVWNAIGNADGHRTTLSKVGLVSGIATAAFGSVVATWSAKDARPVGLSIGALGVTSIGLSIRSMRNHSAVVAEREAERARLVARTTSIAPIVSVANGGSAGVSVSMRF